MSLDEVTVSAIIPTRDRPALLQRALDAVLAQVGDALVEVIVVYDQSKPDLSHQGLSGYVPVRVITNTRRPGLAGARNSGIAAATGAWIAFCDDDDVWSPDKLQHQEKAVAAAPDTDFVVGGITIAYGDKRIERRTSLKEITFQDLLLSRVMEAHPSTFLVRRSAIHERIGMVDEDLPGELRRGLRLAPSSGTYQTGARRRRSDDPRPLAHGVVLRQPVADDRRGAGVPGRQDP